MSKTREQKILIVDDLATKFNTAKSVVFASFSGLKMNEIDEIRSRCKKQQMAYVVGKKTLLKRAIEKTGTPVNADEFDGGVSLIFGFEDEMGPIQVVAPFAKAHGVVKIFGGIFSGAFIASSQVLILAALPTKQQLLGQLAGTLQAPVFGFVNVLAGNIRGLVMALGAIKEQKV